MKKFTIIIIFLICILFINGCNKEIINNNETISDRKQNIINLVKQELINDNVKSLNIEKIYFDGYYTNDSNSKYLVQKALL